MSLNATSLSHQKTLRRQLRHQRLTLSPQQRLQKAHQAIRHLLPIARRFSSIKTTHSVKVGVYLDAFGELPTQPLIDWAYRHGFWVYLPVVKKPNEPLVFVKVQRKNHRQLRLIRHQLGMQQPASEHCIYAHQLDILFMPLVAFDTAGYRMGMGGGFYDKTLAKTKHKPLKIGYAYDFQQVERLDVNPWDIKLDMAATPSKLYNFKRYLLPKSALDKPNTDEIIESDALDERLISQVMNVDRLEQLLAQAEAFGFVNSENLDDF